MKPALIASKFTRPPCDKRYCEDVEMALSATDCALNREQAIYCSTELTTGQRVYKALRNRGLKTTDELKDRMGREWFRQNIYDVNAHYAAEFAEYVHQRLADDHCIIITPAPFYAPGWGQKDYLEFWRRLLRSRIKSVWFNSDWEFSDGCTFEFAVAQEVGLRTLNRNGNTLDCSEGIELIKTAIEKLGAEDFKTSELRENLEWLQAVSVNSAESGRRSFASRVNGVRVGLKRHRGRGRAKRWKKSGRFLIGSKRPELRRHTPNC